MPLRPRAVRRVLAVGASAALVAGLTGCARSEARAEAVAARPAVDCRVSKCVALTFDDGPAPPTRELVDILTDRDVHATFFMLGEQVRRHPKLARRVARAGFQLGDHTWDHANLTALTAERVRSELAATADEIEDVTGRRPDVMRPPQGLINPAVSALVDLPVILWSVDTRDWLTHDPDRVVEVVRREVRPGSIVLLHDVHRSSVRAVPRIVDLLRADGYSLVTVDELYGHPLKAGKRYRGREGAYADAHGGPAR
jgi:peptidoglycan/xylan/chitin deacetylase (PgdA/CDA1 family)